ncbi:aminoglycoside phosphotransferase family protein [Isoptericola variabilis]|uniref:Aminoglycoside phosphotransferase n=1 Tax=Isoptericola variabilis (strain 225) TaxID=743718 RepID=F6FQV1_ISOV2|nr:aminoglycoside phosphotransferase family protein [Isoptericola variabilis]AEG42916.1 aminoglycoside phosphotransferase [Isoptericola variabilis 225]TWH31835.1 aminoglycoside phosphotransferase (APT) family kinase protein [Isoptericola variabilis J7]
MSLHDDEIRVTADDVRRLVRAQLPRWADLPVRPVAEAGTDHRLFGLGDELVARMPKIGWAAEQAASDAQWLPRLAPHLPLTVPAPVALGEPDDGYPFAWSVVPWLPGEAAADPLDPAASHNLDLDAAAEQLGAFVAALREVEPAGGPVKDGTGRGVPLARLDRSVREAIAASGTRIDGRAATRAWERALEADPYDGPPRWLHGDLIPGNLLVERGRLTAVIDWGALGLGDPAADLTPAWQLFSGRSRAAFREASGVGHTLDEAAWERGKGWVLVQAVVALPYYWDRWPAFGRASQRRVAAALDDAA